MHGERIHSCSFPSVAVKNSHGKLDTGKTLDCSLVVRANYCATQLFKAAKLFTSFEKKISSQFGILHLKPKEILT